MDGQGILLPLTSSLCPGVRGAPDPPAAPQGARGGGRCARAERGGALADRQLVRAGGLGHVRDPLRRPSGPPAAPHVRRVPGASAPQGLSRDQTPAPDRAQQLTLWLNGRDARFIWAREDRKSVGGGEG